MLVWGRQHHDIHVFLSGGKKWNDWIAELTWLISDNANVSQLLKIPYSTPALFEARLEKQIEEQILQLP